MEILNILYNNNLIAVYLIGAILVVILIFIVLSSMTTTPKVKNNEEEILQDPTENEDIPTILETKEEPIKEEIKDIPKINEIVEDLYQQKINEEQNQIEENQDLNSFLEEFEVPNNIIEEVTNSDLETPIEKQDNISDTESVIEIKEEPIKQEENIKSNNPENIESMLKRLYDLRQNENNARKNALLNEIYDLKKQVDETLKAKDYNYSINYNEVDTKALADYYLFNEDIEFPKLK